jgi:PGF-pre-PGF domain-containing protein
VDTTQRAVEQISRIELTFSGSGADVIFEGEVTLPDENVTVTSSQGTDYSIPARTPLGALDTVAGAQGFSYAVTDKKWADSGILMLDDIGAYPYVKGGNSWVCYVNGVALDDYGSPATDGLNVRALADGDHVNFYYGPKGVTAETAEAVVSITVDIGSGADVFFEGDVVLPDENVTVTSSQGTDYSIPVRTPLGALDTVSKAGNFTYAVTDKKWADSGILMVDDIGAYPFVKGQKAWVCYVNGVLLDDYAYPATDGLNVRALAEGDKVNYYYGPKGATTPENAEAAILLTARLSNADILFSGEVVLDEGNVTVTSSQGTDYSIPARTPLGALDTVAGAQGFSYAVTDKKWADSGILMLDDIGAYPYVKGGNSWVCYVNGVALDDYGSPATDGLNVRALVAGDQVNFYYGPKGVTAETAEAAVLITVRTGSSPGDWTLSMIGAQTVTVTSDYFESGIACGHNASWTDPETGDVWAGMPLWFLVGMVDDIESGSHYTFNDAFAAEGYSVKVTSKDGYSINIPSADMARNSGFIVANTLNGSALPETIGEKSKPCWPLQIKGADASAGQLVGAIASIELVGLPEPSDGWTLRVCGVVNDTITQAEFEELGCHGGVTYTDEQGIVWSGVPLWYLVGVSDNIETTTHWTFDDDAAAANYTIRVAASDGYSQSYGSAQVARSNGYILANLMDGQPIPETDSSYPIKLVGDNVPKKVKGVAEIDLVDLIPPPPAEGSWNLALKGPIDYTCTQDFFELAYSCSHHKLSWTDPVTGERWTGIGLWELVGWVDDRVPHGANGFNDVLADTGYTVIVTASDGYSKEFSSKDIARNNNYIVANKLNGSELSKEGNKPSWPLRLVGADVSTHASVGGIASIELTEFQKPVDVPTVHIVKFAADGTTIVNETTIDYLWMQQNLQVYGDDQPYKFQGVTFDPNDLWNPDETLGMNPPKIEEIIRGTSVRDLVDLVGGMPEGTEITFVARDGWETNLGWNNIYDPNPRQGEAVLVWWTERQGYVPAYEDGYRLFYTPEDHVFGQWDMHESMLDKYWHYYSSGGIVYPSCAGISPKWISEIRIYSAYETDWTLNLTGEHSTDISKGFFESALTCTMGANHKAQYTDADGKVWAGMPLYLLCGWVDDSNEHSGKAFNRTLALEGYCIEIIGTNGKIVTLNSRDIIDSRDYLIANTLNGSILDEEGGQWPLVFNGANVSAAMQVDAVKQIRLDLSGTFQDVTNVTAGETAAVPVANASVSMVNITAAQNITQFTVAASVTSLPSEVPQPDATLYQVMQITLFGANEDAIGSAEISFSLPLAWLEASGIAPEDAKLYRWHEGAWQTLPTTYLGSADGYANYTAVTPGFSYFAVGGTPTPGPTPTPSPRSSSSSSSSSSIAAVSGTVGAGGSATFPVSQTAFSSITVNAADQISNLLLTVQAASLPRDVPMPAGQVYEIQQVTLYRADSSAVSGAIISFAVENSWLKTNGLTSADIVLMRYADGAWQSLQTTFVEEKDGKAYFTAKTPGFSYFAIVGESGEAVPAEALAAEATTTPVTTTAPAGTTAAPATTPAQSPVFWALPFAALGVLLLFRRG